MGYQHVIHENRGPVSWLILNRPENLNAFNIELAREALDALCKLLEDRETRVLVITGKGRAFSSGADVIEVGANTDPAGKIDTLVTIAHQAIEEIRQAQKPIIAAINHQAAGYGMALALACDIRVATEKVRLHYGYSRIGLTGDGGINYFLPKMMGISRALEVALTGEVIGKEEAEKFGMISKFFPEESFVEDTQALAERVSSVPSKTAAAIKRMMYSSLNADLLLHLTTEKTTLIEMAGTPEFRELIKRFQKE